MPKSKRIPLFRPLIDAGTFRASQAALENGWLGMGSFVAEFESRFRRYLDNPDRKVVSCSTATAALHMAMLLCGIGEGDEVITPSLNNIGDLQAIRAVGANPVFCDIREDNLGIDIDKAEALVSNRTRAIIPLHYAGIPCAIDATHAFAQRHSIRVIEDCCHAVGTMIDGKPAGSSGDISIYSFDAIKTITCIDGGALAVNTEKDVEYLHQYRLLGMTQKSEHLYKDSRSYQYDVLRIGFRYHLANLHASIGLSQLDSLNDILAARRRMGERYATNLAGLPLRCPGPMFQSVGLFIFYIIVAPEERQTLRNYLTKRGIETGVHWMAGHRFSFFANCRRGDLSVTERIGDGLVTLPSHAVMANDDIDYVCEHVREYYKQR